MYATEAEETLPIFVNASTQTPDTEGKQAHTFESRMTACAKDLLSALGDSLGPIVGCLVCVHECVCQCRSLRNIFRVIASILQFLIAMKSRRKSPVFKLTIGTALCVIGV